MTNAKNDTFDLLNRNGYKEIKDPLRVLEYLAVASVVCTIAVFVLNQLNYISKIYFLGAAVFGLVFVIYKSVPRTCPSCKNKMKAIDMKVYSIFGERDQTVFCCDNCKTKITTKIKTSDAP